MQVQFCFEMMHAYNPFLRGDTGSRFRQGDNLFYCTVQCYYILIYFQLRERKDTPDVFAKSKQNIFIDDLFYICQFQ